MAELQPPPFFIGDDLALDFLNSIAAPWGQEIEWLGRFRQRQQENHNMRVLRMRVSEVDQCEEYDVMHQSLRGRIAQRHGLGHASASAVKAMATLLGAIAQETAVETINDQTLYRSRRERTHVPGLGSDCHRSHGLRLFDRKIRYFSGDDGVGSPIAPLDAAWAEVRE